MAGFRRWWSGTLREASPIATGHLRKITSSGVLYIIYWGSGATGKPLSYIREIREELTIHFRTWAITIMYSNVYIMYTRYHPIPSHSIPCPVQSSRLITGNYIFIQHTMSYFPLCAPFGAQQEESRNGLVSSAKAFRGTRPACGQSWKTKERTGREKWIKDSSAACVWCGTAEPAG